MKKFSIITILIILITCLAFIIEEKSNVKTVETSAQSFGTKKIGWGIKRNDNHKQPDLGKINKEIIEKNNGIAMGNSNDKYIYLTFDEGYEAGYTESILNTLKDNDVKAIFFLTAHYVNTNPDLVRRMIDEGHVIGNHTVNHKSMPDLSDEEINKEVMELHQVLYDKFGYEMKFLRPPMGEFSERTLKYTSSLGYKTVMWSFAYQDWNENKQPDESSSKEKIIKNFHNGEIMLLHGNSKTNTNILDAIIKEAKNEGYEFKLL